MAIKKTRKILKIWMMHVNSAICFIKSHFILVKMAIFIFISWGESILIHLSVTLPISLPFMDGHMARSNLWMIVLN